MQACTVPVPLSVCVHVNDEIANWKTETQVCKCVRACMTVVCLMMCRSYYQKNSHRGMPCCCQRNSRHCSAPQLKLRRHWHSRTEGLTEALHVHACISARWVGGWGHGKDGGHGRAAGRDLVKFGKTKRPRRVSVRVSSRAESLRLRYPQRDPH